MVGLTSLLVLAVAVLSNTHTVFGEQCGYISIGDTSGTGIDLQKTTLQPGTADWQVVIPKIPQCPNPVGSKAIVCDHDVLPTGRYVDLSLIVVRRVGNLQGLGSVKPTVYCGSQWSNSQQWWPNQQNDPSISSPVLDRSPLASWNTSPLTPWNRSPVTQWNQSPVKLTARPL